jgi:serine/threonine protein phosphatase PrpC
MQIKAVGATNIGRKRKANQDSYRVEPTQKLFIVADGMGGHAGGELASRITVETIAESIKQDRASHLNITPDELLMGAIHRANSNVYAHAQKEKSLAGMGTTVVTMLFDDINLYIGHVGDSRAYLLQPGKIWQLTRDHSLVNEKLRAGIITREQMRKDKSRNVITRSVGFESSVLVDLYKKELQPNEIFLTCSDGLTGMVEDAQILATIDELGWNGPLEAAAERLIQLANQNGGDDNITVILARVEG